MRACVSACVWVEIIAYPIVISPSRLKLLDERYGKNIIAPGLASASRPTAQRLIGCLLALNHQNDDMVRQCGRLNPPRDLVQPLHAAKIYQGLALLFACHSLLLSVKLSLSLPVRRRLVASPPSPSSPSLTRCSVK